MSAEEADRTPLTMTLHVHEVAAGTFEGEQGAEFSAAIASHFDVSAADVKIWDGKYSRGHPLYLCS